MQKSVDGILALSKAKIYTVNKLFYKNQQTLSCGGYFNLFKNFSLLLFIIYNLRY